jgi:uncharacterized repeat protein (TIGR02543 family)
MFNINGGSTVPSQKIAWNLQATAPITPTKTGFSFDGWFSNSTLTEPFDFSTPITGAKTIYAKWTTTFRVVYNGNGSDGGAVPVDNMYYQNSQEATVLGNPGSLVRTGYAFVCWNTQADTLGLNYSETNKITIANTNVTLYAKWRPNTYTISFETGTGTPASPTSKVITFKNTYGALTSPVRAGYLFGGWWTGPGGTGTQITSTTLVSVAANDTLFSKWTAETYTITYVLDGGTNNVNNPGSYTVESSLIVLQEAKRSGYQFDGWYYDTLTRMVVTEIKTGSTGDRTLFAQWVPLPYTITYVLNGGDNHLQNPETYTIETNTINLLNAKRADWDFGGWYSDSNFTKPVTTIIKGSTGNKIFYANWNRLDRVMVLIHSKDSAFLMGSNNGYSYEKPVHSVTFTYDFWMDSTEVTQADFSTVMGFNPSLFSSVINGPVEYVTWFDAALYCNNRSKRDGLYTIYTYTTKKNGRILLS